MARVARAPTRRTNAEWTQESVEALVRAAQREFARLGYDAASVDAIAADVGLTKGAVYYHFKSKEALFEAAFRAAEAELVRRIEQRAGAATSPVEAVVQGSVAFLEVACDDALRRVTLLDGPRVLGWTRWRAIDAEFGLGSLKEGLSAALGASREGRASRDLLAHLLSGALNEAVFSIAESPVPRAAFARAAPRVARFVRGVLVAAGAESSESSESLALERPRSDAAPQARVDSTRRHVRGRRRA